METRYRVDLIDITTDTPVCDTQELLALPRRAEWVALLEDDEAVFWEVMTVIHLPEADVFDIYVRRLRDPNEARARMAQTASCD